MLPDLFRQGVGDNTWVSSERTGLDVGLTTVAVRAILASQGGVGWRADAVAHRLGEAIRLGLVLDGERLPPEARLAEQLGVAVVTLREALAELRRQGLITTRRGRGGGTVVTAPADRQEDLLARLAGFTAQDLRDLGDQRAAILGTAAALAARRALPADVERLRGRVERFAGAHTPGDLRRADTQLTTEIAAAAQSPRLTREELRLRAEIGDLLWLRPDPGGVRNALRLRRRLLHAIERQDAPRARRVADTLVAADTERLVRQRPAAHRTDRSAAGSATSVLTEPTPGHATDEPAKPPGEGPSRPGTDVLAGLDAEFAAVFAALDDLAGGFAAIVADRGPDAVVRKDLAGLVPAITGLLAAHSGMLVGAGVITRPGLLRDADRWLEWWHGPGPEPLRVNLDPAAPDFYDYTGEDWFQLPRRSGRREIAGPFVDHACTGEYTLTLAVPVTVPTGFLGIAAADVLVSSIERALPRPSEPVVVTTGDGRVVASTDPARLPGTRLPVRNRGPEPRSALGSWRIEP